jgi:hypothetical protein
MNNQSNIPKVYHGKWKVPQYDSWRNITGYQEYMGTLTCDGKKNTLEVYHNPVGLSTLKFRRFWLNGWRKIQRC